MKRRLALGAAVLAAALVIFWWWHRRGDDGMTPAVIASRNPAPPAPANPIAPAAPSAPLDQELPPGAPDPSIPEQPADAPPIELPPDTQMLAEEFVPGTTEWDDVPLLEGDTRSLRILPEHYNVVAPDPIVVLIELSDGAGHRFEIPDASVRIRPAAEPDGWIDMKVTDAGDHLYKATLAPTGSLQKRLFGRVIAEGGGEFPDAGARRIPSAFIYTHGPDAVLTGHWKDHLDHGHLMLDAEVDVAIAGTFTITAELVGPQREPLAWIRTSGPLPTGKGWLTFQVWGKALHDAGVDGPYHVRDVLLTREVLDTGDYEPGRTVIDAYQTSAYKVDDFSTQPWVEPSPIGPQVTADSPSQQGKPPPIGTRVETN